MEKKWKEENARIMAEHSSLTDFSDPAPVPMPVESETPTPLDAQPALPAPAEKSA
jgi:hypothetical protein